MPWSGKGKERGFTYESLVIPYLGCQKEEDGRYMYVLHLMNGLHSIAVEIWEGGLMHALPLIANEAVIY